MRGGGREGRKRELLLTKLSRTTSSLLRLRVAVSPPLPEFLLQCFVFRLPSLSRSRKSFMVIYLPELQDVVVRLVELLLVHFVLQQKSSDCLILISPSQCCSETFCFSASRLAAIFSASSFLRFWMVSTCSVWNWREEICNSYDVMLSWIFSAFSSDLLVLEL